MRSESDKYWERCWRGEEPAQLYKYLGGYYKCESKVLDVFKEHHVTRVCDAACGFGAFSLAFASNGFEVHSFDISETAVEITCGGLKEYGMDSSKVKVASILDTQYPDDFFGGVIAHAVIDHLTVSDAEKALKELFRITAKEGLIALSFDNPEAEDFETAHEMVEEGTMKYKDTLREGMLFHPYGWDEIEKLLAPHEVIYKADNAREKIVIMKK